MPGANRQCVLYTMIPGCPPGHSKWRFCTCMRSVALAFMLLLQAQPLPPPYPRVGTTRLFENDRVTVWVAGWLQQAYRVHPHVYYYPGVYYTKGAPIIVS